MRKNFDRPRVITYTKDYTPENRLDTSVYIDYRNHLLENKQHILNTGYPQKPFKQYLDLDLRMSKTYPTKLPLHITGNTPFFRDMDYLAVTPDIYKEIDTFSYIWSNGDPLGNFQIIYDASKKITPKALVKHILPTVPKEEIVPFQDAAPLEILTEDEMNTIEETRDTLFTIKLKILDHIIEFTEEKITIDDFLQSGLRTVSENLTLDDLLFLLRIDEKYEHSGVARYLNKLLSPVVHSSMQYIGLRNITIDDEERGLKPVLFLNCGGVSDILYTLGNTGKLPIYKKNKKAKNDKPIDIINRIEREEKNYWQRYKYMLEKFLEKQMEREISITTTLKGEYVKKYLPILERIIAAQTDYINEFGRMFDAVETENQTSSGTGLQSKTQEGPSPRYLFRKAGEGFEIAFKGKPSILIKDSVGLRYIQFLLSNPNTTVPVQELYSMRQTPPADRTKLYDYGSLTEEGSRSSKEYNAGDLKFIREELHTLQQEKEEANDSHNFEKAEELQRKIEEITDYVKKSENLKRDPQLEKIRTGVTNAIRNAIERIQPHDPELAQHLNEKISTGYQCMYTNSPSDNITWRFQ